jgi:Zn finger protein HypA/HybF involved in hydrogenase expression
MSKDLECPYCGAGHDVEPEDRGEGTAHQMECGECENTFVYYSHISFDYTPYKADCLNGGEHKWKQTYADHNVKILQCEDCQEQRFIRNEKK